VAGCIFVAGSATVFFLLNGREFYSDHDPGSISIAAFPHHYQRDATRDCSKEGGARFVAHGSSTVSSAREAEARGAAEAQRRLERQRRDARAALRRRDSALAEAALGDEGRVFSYQRGGGGDGGEEGTGEWARPLLAYGPPHGLSASSDEDEDVHNHGNDDGKRLAEQRGGV